MIRLVTIILSFFTLKTFAQLQVVSLSPNGSVSSFSGPFSLEINQIVNRPNFTAFIRIHSNSANSSVLTIDVLNTNNVTYTNKTLNFFITNSTALNLSDISILLDQGVLFSNSSINSSAIIDRQFWRLTLNSSTVQTSTTTSTTTTSNTTSTMTGTTTSTTATNSNTTSNSTTTSQVTTTQNANQTTTTQTTTKPGDDSPSHSARVGIGIGITFISVVVIGEIVYFKFFYRSYGRSGNYAT